MESAFVRSFTYIVLTVGLLLVAGVSALRGQVLPVTETENQNIDTYIELLRHDIKQQKVAITSQLMELSAEQAVVFWPIYSEYEKELAALGSKRVDGIKDYAANYLTLTDQKADELANGRLALESQLIELKKKYYQRFKTALSAKMAAKFLQIENQLLSILDLQIASSLPIVE